ncbi:MAG: hypothetical protein ACPKQO_09010 [Nitrososphaeraceae archaeon]
MNSKKKIKIELEDTTGGKYNLSLEGNISKEKILQAVELMDLVNSNNSYNNTSVSHNQESSSIDSKIWNIIIESFSNTKFTSTDIVNFYQEKYHDPIKLSVISTYLARYCNKGKLTRNKKLREYVYYLQNSNTYKNYPHSTSSISSISNSNATYSYNITNHKKTIHDLQN